MLSFDIVSLRSEMHNAKRVESLEEFERIKKIEFRKIFERERAEFTQMQQEHENDRIRLNVELMSLINQIEKLKLKNNIDHLQERNRLEYYARKKKIEYQRSLISVEHDKYDFSGDIVYDDEVFTVVPLKEF